MLLRSVLCVVFTTVCATSCCGQLTIGEIGRLNGMERSVNGSPGHYVHPLKYLPAGRLLSKEFPAAEELATKKAAVFGTNITLT